MAVIASERTYGAKKITRRKLRPRIGRLRSSATASASGSCRKIESATRIPLCSIASRKSGSPNASR